MNLRGWIGLWVLAAWGCVEDNDEAVLDAGAGQCIPGRTLECACPGGEAGTQACQDDLTFSACVCGEDPPPPDDDAGVAGECREGEVDTRECAANGTESRFCGADGRWGEWSVCEAPCDDGSQQIRPCGRNRRGEERRDCADGTWSDWAGCEDPDACTDGEMSRQPCGVNGDGSRRRTCEEGQWGDYGECEDTAECANGAERSEPCGRNDNGLRTSVCQDGAWSPAGDCADPDECTGDAEESRACGLRENGTQARRCVGGQWTAWAPCDDPDAVCEPGAIEMVPCGLNRRGRQSHTCEDGGWGAWTDCEDPDECVDGALQRRLCGRDDTGTQARRCAEGEWDRWGECEGQAVCAEGDRQERECGLNGRGRQARACLGGAWGDFGACADPDECVDEDAQSEACGEDGQRSRTCRQGEWGNWTACIERNADCPLASVAMPNLVAEPLDRITLRPGAESLPGGPGEPVAWRWVVVDRPAGSTAPLLEPSEDPEAERRDDVSTPEAEFFLDLAGEYTFELQVEGQSGNIAPSEACPQGPARMHVQVTSREDIHIQLVWDTPRDGDQTDQQGTDLDIHLRHPDGRWGEAPLDCFWMNTEPDWGPPGPVGNPSLDIDDTNGAGPENINLDDPADTGDRAYEIGVVYYRSGDFVGGMDFGPSTATVRVFLGGELADTFERELTVERQFWIAARIQWDEGEGRVRAGPNRIYDSIEQAN